MEGRSKFLAGGTEFGSMICLVTEGDEGSDGFLTTLRDELLDEDFDPDCSGLFGSRSFVFVANCRHCVTVFDGRLSPGLNLDPADVDRGCDNVLGNDLALIL